MQREDGIWGMRFPMAKGAEAAKLPKRMADAIAGHNEVKDASNGYFHPASN
jgi:hypothetical protein